MRLDSPAYEPRRSWVGSLMHRDASLLTKWLWRFMQEGSSLLRKVIASIYGVSSWGWKTRDFKMRKGNRLWIDIVVNYPLFDCFIKFQAICGKNIRFWICI